MKKIAALTMVRNDDFYLRKWVEYYGAQLGRENLYIWFDGTDQVIAPFCEGTHAQLHEKIGMQVVSAEKGRLKFLSDQAAALLAGGYDLVIGVDADEFVVVDPKRGISLREYLSEQRIGVSLSALGLDFGQKLGEEPPSCSSATTRRSARATPSPQSSRNPACGDRVSTASRGIISTSGRTCTCCTSATST